MLRKVNKLQNCVACLHLLASKCPLTQGSIPDQDDSSVPIGVLRRKFPN